MGIPLEDKIAQGVNIIVEKLKGHFKDGVSPNKDALTKIVVECVNKPDEQYRNEALAKLGPAERKVLGLENAS